jgi:uncharacterized membrane protein
MDTATNYRPLIAAGVSMGIGLGGFVDGILFHQILQWHGMVTHYYPKTGLPPDVIVRNMQINMFWDGLFHSVTWLSTVTGLALLWRAGARPDVPWSGRTFAGSLPLGWGLFNFVEGIIDHHVLHVHHVSEDAGHLAWDLGFLGSGIFLIALGLIIIRTAKEGPLTASSRVRRAD